MQAPLNRSLVLGKHQVSLDGEIVYVRLHEAVSAPEANALMDYIIACDLAIGNLGMVVVTEGDFSITPEARRTIAQRSNFNGRPLMPMAVIGTGPVVRAIFILLINAIRITLRKPVPVGFFAMIEESHKWMQGQLRERVQLLAK